MLAFVHVVASRDGKQKLWSGEMRQLGIHTTLALICLLLATRAVHAQSNLFNVSLDESVAEEQSVFLSDEMDISPVIKGTIFASKPLNFSGDVTDDGGNLNLTYRFGKNFMGFEANFGGAAATFNSGLSANGIGGSNRLSYRSAATLSYRIGRFVAPNVAVYGMVGTSLSQLGSTITVQGTGFDDSASFNFDGSAAFNGDTTESEALSDPSEPASNSGASGGENSCVYNPPSSSSNPSNLSPSEPPLAADSSSSSVASVALSAAPEEFSFSGSSEEYRGISGVMIGAGLEMLLGSKFHLRAEYRFIDFGSLQQTVDISTTSANLQPSDVPASALFDLDSSFHSAQISVLYKF